MINKIWMVDYKYIEPGTEKELWGCASFDRELHGLEFVLSSLTGYAPVVYITELTIRATDGKFK